MLKVTLTANDSPITVQDPRPVNQANNEQGTYSVQPNTTREMIMQWGQLERISGQLDALAAAGLGSFSIESAGGSSFAEQADAVDNPAIDLVDGAVLAAGGSTPDLVGTNLLAGQVQASASVVGDTTAGSVLLECLNPGYDGNLYDVEVVDSGSGGLSSAVATVDGREVVTVDLGGAATATCTTVAASLATTLAGLAQATVVGTGATAITTVQAVTAFTGGEGTGLSITLAGAACTVSAIDLSGAPIEVISLAATPAVTGGAAADIARLRVRSNAKEDVASVVLS